MAGIQWSGGKCHGATEAKAIIRHNDRIMRLSHHHSNDEIDNRLTYLNVSYRGLFYPQKAENYDRQIESAICRRRSSGKNSTVTMQDLCIYCPAGMIDENTGEYDYDRVLEWFNDIGRILEDDYGDDLIDLEIHFDEVHQYVDPATNTICWSRPHAHAELVPVMYEAIEDDEGELQAIRVLNAKKFSSRARITALNNKVHEMTLTKYDMPYMDGTKKKGKSTVEELKRQSAEALRRMQEELEQREKAVQRREQEAEELIILGRRARAEQLAGTVTEVQTKTGRRLPVINS